MVPLIPVRYIFTALAFIGFVFNYTLRVGHLNFHKLHSFPDQHEPGDHFDGQPDRSQHQPGKTRSLRKCKKCKTNPPHPSTIPMSGWTLRLGQRRHWGRSWDVLCRLHGVSGVSLHVLWPTVSPDARRSDGRGLRGEESSCSSHGRSFRSHPSDPGGCQRGRKGWLSVPAGHSQGADGAVRGRHLPLHHKHVGQVGKCTRESE